MELDAKWKATLIILVIAIVYLISPIDFFPWSQIDDTVFVIAALVIWAIAILIDTRKEKKKPIKEVGISV